MSRQQEDDTPKWLKDYQRMFPEKSLMQKQIDELKARVEELEKHNPARKTSTI
ncbi:MAG TPA: hypothetical protein VJP79_08705 [Nitrososphaera sp.]|nr:hypothetical protein [Nitrososphaera sp.]